MDKMLHTIHGSDPRKAIRLLVIEDDPDDALLLSELLEASQANFEIEHVDSMAKALHRLDAGGIDIVLSDLSLPDTKGIHTFLTIHARVPNMPVIVLSGMDNEELATEIVEKGAQDYLVKGRIDCFLLVRSIRYAMKRAEADRALAEERNLLRSVIDAQPDSIYVKDIEGRYLLDNSAHAMRLGVASRDAVMGKTAYDFFPPEIASKFHNDDDTVMKSGKPIINYQEAATDAQGRKYWLSTTKVPLRNRAGEIIGLVGVGRDITERKRAEEQVAISSEQLRQKNAQMEDDLRMASEVQQAFLPQQFNSVVHSSTKNTLRFYSSYLPTGGVGGDFFHILPLSEHSAGVFISDVMGHGVRAAMVTALQRAFVEEFTGAAKDPGKFLSQINRALLSILRRTGTPLFVSAFYMFIDAEKSQLRYAVAGHPKQLLLRRHAAEIETLPSNGEKPGPALGVFGDQRYKTLDAELTSGDMAMLFTDGLFEVEGADGSLFDQKMLAELAKSHMKLPPEAMSEAILSDVKKFSADGRFDDDVCLLLMDFEGDNGANGSL